MAIQTSGPYELRKLGIGGVLDQAIRIVRDNLKPLLIIVSPMLVFAILNGLLAVYLFPAGDPSTLTADQIAANQSAALTQGAIYGAIGTAITLLLIPWVNGSLIHFVSQRYLGHEITATAAMARGWKRYWPLFWTQLLYIAVVTFGFILLIIPGIFFIYWYLLSYQVAVIERLSGYAAMKRAKQLVKGSLSQLFLLMLVLTVFNFLLGAGAGFIPDLNIRVAVSGVLGQVLGLVSLAALVVFYFSCRCKVENYDLEHLAAEMAGRDSDLPSDGEPPRAA